MRDLPLAPLVKFTSLAVVVALATTVLALTIANAQPGGTTSYAARFTDAAGLLPGDEVRIAGVVVGAVDEVRVVDRRIAEVTFSVRESQRIPASVGRGDQLQEPHRPALPRAAAGRGPTGRRCSSPAPRSRWSAPAARST